MADYDEDDLVNAVESMTTDTLSSMPYWNLSDSQRAEWRRYAQQKQQRDHVQQRAAEEDDVSSEYNSASGEEEGEAEAEEKEEENETTPRGEEGGEEEPAATERVDRRKLWVQYQAIARNDLREEKGKSKIPLSEVNDRARVMWAEDNWAKEK